MLSPIPPTQGVAKQPLPLRKQPGIGGPLQRPPMTKQVGAGSGMLQPISKQPQPYPRNGGTPGMVRPAGGAVNPYRNPSTITPELLAQMARRRLGG